MIELALSFAIGATLGYFAGKITLRNWKETCSRIPLRCNVSGPKYGNTKPITNQQSVPEADDRFYLINIHTLLEEYDIDINKPNPFDHLCIAIEIRSKIDLFKRFSNVTSIGAALQLFKEAPIPTFDISNSSKTGTSLTREYLLKQLPDIQVPEARRLPIEKVVELVLNYYQGKGIGIVLENLEPCLRELEDHERTNSPELYDQYEKFKKLVTFQLKLHTACSS